MQPRAYKRPISVLVVVHTRAGEVLLLRRRVPADFWQSVTGSLEWDETPAEAAHREVVEETGLDVPPAALVDCETRNRFRIVPPWRQRYAPDAHENVEHVFHLQIEERVPVRLDPHEHVEFRWLGRDAAAALASSPTNREAILVQVGVL